MVAQELSRETLKGVLEFSIQLARDAGKLILEGSDAILRSPAEAVEEKKNSVNIFFEIPFPMPIRIKLVTPISRNALIHVSEQREQVISLLTHVGPSKPLLAQSLWFWIE